MKLPEVNRRILIVDDEAEIRKGYKMFLNPEPTPQILSSRVTKKAKADVLPVVENFEIAEAESGEAALKVLKSDLQNERRFAGAIVDVKMPGRFDGLEFIQEAWKLDPDLLVVVATAHHDRTVDEISEMFGKEFQDQWDYLNKPFTSGEIRQKARQLVSAWNRRQREKQYIQRIEQQQTMLRMHEQLATIGRLARSVGHEFGNILQQVITKVDLLKMQNRKKQIDGVDTLAEEIADAVLLGSNICQDLLTVASQQVDRVERYKKEPAHIDAVIDRSLRLMRHEIKKKDIRTKLELDPKIKLPCDSSRLVQVLLNLIANAVYAMKDGGSLYFKSYRDSKQLCLSVQDTGEGILEENMAHLFEPLFTTKGKYGNGLGLYVCKSIVEGFGGNIQITSISKQGTTVFISFPE